DSDWIYTNAITANYTNVPPGRYIFRVIAANQDGIWNNNGATIELNIKPAIWQTTIFKIVIFTGLIILLFIWYKRRIYKIKRDKKQLQQQVEFKTHELSDANKALEEQNEELKTQREELQSQRDSLENANILLEEKSLEIEQKNSELEQHRENLERLVYERTSQLNIAKEKAEQSDRLKTAFLANLSHEIRTPLNAIVGFSTLLETTEVGPDKRKYYSQIIQSSSESLLVLIDDILNMAKIETDQLEINLQSFSINALLEELHFLFSQKTIIRMLISDYRLR
ncbi:MAG: hypothetical protein HC830_12880, partial [Bacteroidetes bacterium]|nr:hypothetical protein [Bacteroidota bacterium]